MNTTADLIRAARKEAFKEAAQIAGRYGDKIMRVAQRHHEDEDYDRYEELECQARIASVIEDKLLRKSKRP